MRAVVKLITIVSILLTLPNADTDITQSEKEKVIKLISIMFNLAPDQTTYQFVETLYSNSDKDLIALANSLESFALSSERFLGDNRDTQVSNLLSRLGLSSNTQEGTIASDYLYANLNNNIPISTLCTVVIEYLDSDRDPLFDNTASLLDNKVTAALEFINSGYTASGLDDLLLLTDITLDESSLESFRDQIDEKLDDPILCAQVITYAIDPATNICTMFPTPCSVPQGWESCSSDDVMTTVSYPIVDTNQQNCYNSSGISISCSGSGQDGEFTGNTPSYTDNGDGTVTDNITGVMWQQTADTNGDGTIDVNDKYTQTDAVNYCENLTLAGYYDWELPDIKTMYSLIDFSGEDVSVYQGEDTSGLNPFINDEVFGYGYGDTSAGERIIDAQWATTSLYTANEKQMFGVNLADGRIKGYGDPDGNTENNKNFYVQCVRDKGNYAENNFEDNGDNTISDKATTLMWEQNDNGSAVDWDDALAYCSTSTTGEYTDWRLPDAKELQSIVDYTRSPNTTNSAALHELFNATSFTNEGGQADYGFYWSSTTHKSFIDKKSAVYISFGRSLGYMNNDWKDVHGAGAQRSDPKDITTADTTQYTVFEGAYSRGPQGDVVRGLNYVRCVRNNSTLTSLTIVAQQ